MKKSIKLKRVLITGSARGIGLEIARQFALAGAEVVITDLDGEAALASRDAMREEGYRCHAYPMDVTDEASLLEVRDRLHTEAGTLDVIVNNAGVVFGGPFLDVPLEKHRLTYRVNTEGLVAVTHVFLPDLIDQERGHVVNVASASGFVGLPGGSTYASSKWAVIGFSESLRLELKHMGLKDIGVTTVCPSYVDTGMFEGVKPPLLTRFLSPGELAEKIVIAVERNQLYVLEPWLVKMTPFLKGVLPTGLSDALSEALGASSGMQTWKGHGA